MTPETANAVAPKRKKITKKKTASRAVSTVVRHAPVPVAPSNLLQVILQATLDPRCDVAKMQALLDMQRQIEGREERKAFTVAFNALQAKLPIVTKDGKIDHGDGVTAKGNKKLKTSFATYPNLNRVCGPLLKKHGFTFSSSVEPEPSGAMIVVSTLEHIAGGSRSTRFRLTADATGGKNNQQGWGSSQQYGMRYNMIALLNIVSEAKEDADNDGFAATDDTTITEAQTKELVKLLDDAGADKEKFCVAMGVDGIAMIPAKEFSDAKSRIARYKAAKAAAAAKADFPGDRK
jgi:hypothetical protein